MMPTVYRVEARAHSRATEVVDRVVAAVQNVFPDEARRRVAVETRTVEGHGGIPLVIVTASLKGEDVGNRTFEYLANELSEGDRIWLNSTLDRRVDQKCVLFLRVDKQRAYRGQIVLAAGPDIISLQIHFRNGRKCKRSQVIAFIRNVLALTQHGAQ